MNKKKKILIYIFSLLLSFLIFIPHDDFKLKVIFFDIGQGDSSFIRVNNMNILIDGGPDRVVLRRLGDELSFFNRTIDLIIVSHYHEDHITGLIDVIKRYRVKRLLYFKGSSTSPTFDILLTIARKYRVKIIEIENVIDFNLANNCSLKIISPKILNVPFNENNSTITKLDCYQHTFLFSGDNEYKVEQALVKTNFNLQADVFKASHHGSNTSNKGYFLDFVQPRIVVISAGKNNKFHHPNKEVLDRLENYEIKIFRTDQQGNITFRY